MKQYAMKTYRGTKV